MDISEIRRINLRRLAALSSWTDLAERLGYRQPSFLVQMAGPNHTRTVTEKSARRFEKELGLPYMSLDRVPDDLAIEQVTAPSAPVVQVSAPSPAAPEFPADFPVGDIVGDAINLVASVSRSERLDLSPVKRANLVVLALTDALEHDGHAREHHIRSMVRLSK